MKAHENPFSASAIAKLRYRLPKAQLLALCQGAAALGPISAVVGPEGSGKTTLLEDMEAPLVALGREIVWIRLTRESSQAERREARVALKRLRAGQTCLFDGGEVFNFIEWWSLKRSIRAGGAAIIASLHRARGFPVLYRTSVDWPLTRALVHELAGPDLDAIAQASFAANHGNVREVFRSCYWACARQ